MVNRIMYKIFGHKWKYGFTSTVGFEKRVDIRICLRTHKIQYLCTDKTRVLNNGEAFWMNVVTYTDSGAKKHYPNQLLN